MKHRRPTIQLMRILHPGVITKTFIELAMREIIDGPPDPYVIVDSISTQAFADFILGQKVEDDSPGWISSFWYGETDDNTLEG